MRISDIPKGMQRFLNLDPVLKRLFKHLTGIVLVFEIVKLIPPLIFKEIVDAMVAYNPSMFVTVMSMVTGYVGAMFLMSLIEVYSMRYFIHGTNDSEYAIMDRAFRKLISLDLNYHETHNTGYTISKIIKGGHKLVDMLWNTGWGLLPVLLQGLVTLVLLFYIKWEIGILFLFFTPAFAMLLIHGASLTQPSRKKYYRYHDLYTGSITQSIQNVKTVKDHANEDKEIKKATRLLKLYHKHMTKRTRHGMRSLLLEDIFVNLARGSMLIAAVYLMVQGNISAGSLVLIVTLTEKAFINLSRLSRFYYRIQDAEPSIDRFHKLFAQEKQIRDDAASKARVRKGEVDFNNVTFDYLGAKVALRNIDVTIPAKSTVAVVGRSGAGKSTMIKLLLRHFDPSKGSIAIDGIDLRDFALKQLRSDISIVNQDVELFNTTIYDNIAYGIAKPKKQDIIKAAKMAHAHEFINEFKDGYSTIVGERGVKLSGGQKQRIAIARAILRRPKVMIFDEATSSLDAESERFIHEAIYNLIGKMTLIIIAHRFSTIEHADRIILLEKGRVAEIGTHKQLMKKKGIFAKLRRLQELGELTK